MQTETVKALPDKTRVTLAALCRLRIGEPVTMAVVLMLMDGLRPAEAAAALMGDIRDRADYGTYTVLYQMQNGERVPLLKTDNSYRTVVITNYSMSMYRLRAEYLPPQARLSCFLILSEILRMRYAVLNAKYDNAAVAALPVVTPALLDNKSLSAAELTAFCRRRLMMCGVTRSVLQRDLRFSPAPNPDTAEYTQQRTTLPDGTVEYIYTPTDPATRLVAEVTVDVMPGETIEVSTHKGWRVTSNPLRGRAQLTLSRGKKHTKQVGYPTWLLYLFVIVRS